MGSQCSAERPKSDQFFVSDKNLKRYWIDKEGIFRFNPHGKIDCLIKGGWYKVADVNNTGMGIVMHHFIYVGEGKSIGKNR